MQEDFNRDKSYLKAKKKVRQIKIFYLHLAGYAIGVGLLIWNIYIASGPYANFFTWFNTIFIIAWSIFIIIHGWSTFKGRLFFKEKWQEKKMEEFMKEHNETKMWE